MRIGNPTGVTQILVDANLNTETSPGIGFQGDTQTGIYRIGAGSIGFTSAGTLAFTITASGLLQVPTGYEGSMANDEDLANKKYVDDLVTAATPVDLNGLPGFNVTLPLNDDDMLVTIGGELVDQTPAQVRTNLGLVSGGAGDIWVKRAGDTMDSAANIVLSGGGEILGLPSTPSGNTAATSKAYVDSLTIGLIWVNPVWFVDLTTDSIGGANTKDLQTPANNTDAFFDAFEDSDMLVVASGTGVTWTAVGATGTTTNTAGVNAGDVLRWDGDLANNGLTPVWQNIGHISDSATFGDCQTVGVHQSSVRWGLDINTARAPGGSWAGMDNAILELVIQDFDGDLSVTEYDSLWGLCGCGTQEINTITTVAKASIPVSAYFDLYASSFGPGVIGSVGMDPTNASDGGTKFYVWFDTTGADADPAPAGYAEGVKVDVSGDTTDADVAVSLLAAILGHRPQAGGPSIGEGVLWIPTAGTLPNEVIVTDHHTGRGSPAIDGGTATGFGFSRTQQGAFASPTDGVAFYVSNPVSFNFGNQFVFVDGALGEWVLFGGGSAIIPGVGLSQAGNILNVNLGAGIQELPSDEVGIDIRAGSSLITTLDGSSTSTATGAELHLLLDSGTLSQSGSGLKIASSGVTETELATSVAGSGLAGGAGTPLAVNVDNPSGVIITGDAVGLSSVPNTSLTNSATIFDVDDGGSLGLSTIALGGTYTIQAGAGITLSVLGAGPSPNYTGVQVAADVQTVFSRTGAVVAATSDYDADQVDYDPTGRTHISGGSVDVQAAIDELDGAIGTGTFTGLTDTPANYTGVAGQFLRVNSTPDGVEFVDLSDTGVGTSGAALVGVDSTSITGTATTVQGALEDLTTALGSFASNRIVDADTNTYVDTDTGSSDDNFIRMRVGDNTGNWVAGVDIFRLSAAGGLAIDLLNAAGASGATGGGMSVVTGAGDGVGESGPISMTTGAAAAATGGMSLTTGNSSGAASGGILLETGTSTTAAGDITLKAGPGTTTDGMVVIDKHSDDTPTTLRFVTHVGATDYNIDVTAPAAGISGDYNLTLPVDDGLLNQVLTTDGNGALSWTTISAGVTSVFTRTGAVVAVAGDYVANQITFSNAFSGLTAVNVQAAIDEVEGRVDTLEGLVTDLQVQTTTAAQAELSTDGAGGGYYDIPFNQAHLVDLNIIGRRTDVTGEHAAWNVRLVIESTGGVVALAGTPITTVIVNPSGWALSVTADDTNDRLAVKVTGETGKTIEWRATIRSVVTP